MVGASGDITVTGNRFVGNTASLFRGWGGAVYPVDVWRAAVSGNVVLGNRASSHDVESSWGGGVHLQGGGPYTLTNNAFVGNRANTAGSGLWVEQAKVQLAHNTFSGNSGGDGSGVCISGTLSAVTATNTIVAGHGQGVVVTSGGNAEFNHTLWYSNGTNCVGSVSHTANVNGDPAFAPDGYYLTRQSAAVNSGVDAGVSVDIDGQARPSMGGYDIGADELAMGLYLPVVMRACRGP